MYKNFKQCVLRLLNPFVKSWKLFTWQIYLYSHNKINLIVGTGTTKYKSWFATDIVTLDVTKHDDFKQYFKKKKIDKILAEHVLEHLTNTDIDLMLKNFYDFSKESVNIRIAVPDGFHGDNDYINTVKPNGTGVGANDHKHLFNFKSLSAKFEKFGFVPYLKEYWDEQNKFHSSYSNDEFGMIRRSFINDPRNKDGKPNFTSLIIDFKKQ